MSEFMHADKRIEPFYVGFATIFAMSIVTGIVYLVLSRRGWVRWFFVLFVLLGFARFGQSIVDNTLGDWAAIEFVVFACDLLMAVLVFTPSANHWFRAESRRVPF